MNSRTGLTDLERRLLASLKDHVHPKYPHFCEVCCGYTENAPEECHCDYKKYWQQALALITECERKERIHENNVTT